MIIAVAGERGGIGRTTTALGLATAASSAGDDVVLIDSDRRQHGAEAATRGMNTLAEILGHRPLLQVQPLDTPDAVRSASAQRPSGRISILDLAPGRQAELIAAADAVVVPLPDGQLSALEMLLSLKFNMVTAGHAAPVFALPVRVRTGSVVPVEEIEREGVHVLRARIPRRMALQEAASSPWESDWAVLGELYGPAWAELRDRSRKAVEG